MSTGVQIFLEGPCFQLSVPRRKEGTYPAGGSLGPRVIPSLTFYRTGVCSSCTISHPHRQGARDPVSPRPRWHLTFPSCDGGCPDGREVRAHGGSICISLPMGDAGHLFTCLLDIRISSSEKCLCRAWPFLKINHLGFAVAVVKPETFLVHSGR